MDDRYDFCIECDGMFKVTGLSVGDKCSCDKCGAVYIYSEYFNTNEMKTYPNSKIVKSDKRKEKF